MRILLTTGFCALLAGSALVGFSLPSQANLPVDNEEPITEADEEPVELQDLLKYKPKTKQEKKDELPLDIRKEAIIEAAISFGARGGLAKRTYEIRQELDVRARLLDKVFNFSNLLIAAPSGLLIEPPIISENFNSMIIDVNGQTAAVSDRMLNIIRNARIVSTSRDWRVYLEREWGEVLPPPDILLPQNHEERVVWYENVQKGWDYGIKQADEIFKDDLARLESDFQGMIRYRMLLAQGMVSPPYALQIDRGITGGGDEMRIGDRAVQITGVPELMTGAETWKPASR